MTTCFIALGANLGDPLKTLDLAWQAMLEDGVLTQLSKSSWYRSKPMGPADQPDYVNGVVKADTELSPIALLDYLQSVEQQFGRQRLRHWGERTLDLDLLLFGNQHLQEPRLTVPHPGLLTRDFVLVPLLELAPDCQLPDGILVRDAATNIQHHDLIKIS